MNTTFQDYANFAFGTDPADADAKDLEMGMDIMSFSLGMLNGMACAAIYSAFSTVWLGAVLAVIAFILGTLAIVAGVTYLGFTQTAAVEAIGRPVNRAISRVRGWFN